MEDKGTAFARESFPQMSEEERREAIRSLRKLIDEEMFAMAAGADEEPPPGKCPRCGHWHDGSNTYRTTWRGCKNTPYPFYDYWVKQAGWDEKARAALPLAALGA